MATFAELKTDVFRRLNESPSAPVYWSEADVEAAINEGYDCLADATEACETSTSITWTAALHQDLWDTCDGTTAAELLRPIRIQNDTTGQWLTPISVRELDRRYSRWRTVSGQPSYCVMRGLRYLDLHPYPSAAGTATMHYAAWPTALSADDDTPSLPQAFHPALVSYALYDLYAQEGETQKALRYYAEYFDQERRLRDFVASRTARDRLGVFGGD